jgi:hypothetical protein
MQQCKPLPDCASLADPLHSSNREGNEIRQIPSLSLAMERVAARSAGRERLVFDVHTNEGETIFVRS